MSTAAANKISPVRLRFRSDALSGRASRATRAATPTLLAPIALAGTAALLDSDNSAPRTASRPW
ncbi:hypothetical protein LK465_27925 [Nocardia africana]|nr:hypothetical protein [Nocardia africana]